MGVPIVYYVTPQVWAWRAGRMKTLQRHVSLALPIFPFEAPLYQAAGIPVQFLGHPLVDAVPAPPADPAAAAALQAARRIDLGLAPERPTLALLPGSRHNEISRLAPVLAAALPLVAARVPGLQAVVACAPGHRDEEFAALADGVAGRTPDARPRRRRARPPPTSSSPRRARPPPRPRCTSGRWSSSTRCRR